MDSGLFKEKRMSEQLIMSTVGRVERYDRQKGFGWITPYYKYKVGAFVSHRNIIQEIEGTKNLFPEQLVSLDLYKNDRGYEAKKVVQLSEEDYENILQDLEDEKFNKEGYNEQSNKRYS
jgi:cold shock CspA family protein